MRKITVVGSISIDLVTLTAQIPEAGETVFGQSFSMVPGGKGANQAVALARLAPKQVTLIGKVGQDLFGQELLKNLKKNDVLFENVGTVSQLTGIAQITLYAKDNRIVVVPGANESVEVEGWTTEWQQIKESRLVILQNEIPHQTNLAVAQFCRSHQVKVLYNPAPARVTDSKILDIVDYITPNEHECKKLFPNYALEEALLKYPNKLIVTLGVEGVIFYDGERIQRIPALKTNVVDTTGAGDTFNGAFGFALTRGLTVKEAIRFAVVAAHLSVQQFGAQGGMPTLQEIKENENYEEIWHIE